MNWVQINIQVNEEFRYMKIHIFALRWRDEIRRSIGRALHRYRRGHGFKSRTGLNFFQVLFTTTSFSSVLSCEDLLISSLQKKKKSIMISGCQKCQSNLARTWFSHCSLLFLEDFAMDEDQKPTMFRDL